METHKPPVPQFLFPSNSVIASSWAAMSEGVQERPATVKCCWLLLCFFGAQNLLLEEPEHFHPSRFPSLFRIQTGWWNWATRRLPWGNLRVSGSFAGLPAGAQGWPPARAAMPTILRARLTLLASARSQVVTDVGAVLGWLRGVAPPNLALRVLCNMMPCLGTCGHLHFGLSPLLL